MIDRLTRRTKMLVDELRAGGGKEIAADIRRWTWSEALAVGFRCDLSVSASPPPAEVSLCAQPIDDALAAKIFGVTGLSSHDQLFLDRRHNIWNAGFSGGWAAVDPDGEPAYVQWLIPPTEAAKVRTFFGPIFPELPPDTLLVEGAWIPPAFRRRKVMGEGLALVTVAAGEHTPGSRFAVCFPAADNRGACFGTRSAGYEVFNKRTERWRLARRRTYFEAATEADFEIFTR